MLTANIKNFIKFNFSDNVLLFLCIFSLGLFVSYPTLFLASLVVISLYSLLFSTLYMLIKTITEVAIEA